VKESAGGRLPCAEGEADAGRHSARGTIRSQEQTARFGEEDSVVIRGDRANLSRA
jgi:hypothetical protein